MNANPTHTIGPPSDLDVEVGVFLRTTPPPIPLGATGIRLRASPLRASYAASRQFYPPFSLPPPDAPWGHLDPSSYAAVKGSCTAPRRIHLGATIEGSLYHPQPDLPPAPPKPEREGGAPPCQRGRVPVKSSRSYMHCRRRERWRGRRGVVHAV